VLRYERAIMHTEVKCCACGLGTTHAGGRPFCSIDERCELLPSPCFAIAVVAVRAPLHKLRSTCRWMRRSAIDRVWRGDYLRQHNALERPDFGPVHS